jgi:hypothetical protein
MSKFLSVNEKDIIKAFIVSCLSASLTCLYNFLTAWTIIGKAQLVSVGLAGITAGVGYLIKNIFTNSSGTMKPESLDFNLP